LAAAYGARWRAGDLDRLANLPPKASPIRHQAEPPCLANHDMRNTWELFDRGHASLESLRALKGLQFTV
jgi:hypothetical protein